MKTNRFLLICIFAMIVSLLLFSASAMRHNQRAVTDSVNRQIATDPVEGIAVLELFTSQGCSSCPPADALLAGYAKAGDPHIIPLSFHVDYWNRLGWTDPFSNHLFSERQEWYSSLFPGGSVYTPQLVVNGNAETVGNNRASVGKLVQNALKTAVSGHIAVDNVMIENGNLYFHYTLSGSLHSEMLHIALIEKAATTQIRAGENKGVTISNHNIVRVFKTVNPAGDGQESIALPPGFQKSEYALVLYTQDRRKGAITTAMMQSL